MRKIIFLVCILMALSCYKEVEIDIPEQEVLPVVTSIFQSDSTFTVTLSQTQSILQNGPNRITDAVIRLYENGQEKKPLIFNGSSFVSKETAVVGRTYLIEAEIPGFKIASAKEKLVDFPKVLSATYKDSVYVGDEGDLFSQANIEIVNTPEREYFELDMFVQVIDGLECEEGDEYCITNPSSSLYFDPVLNDVVIQNEGLLSYVPSVLVFSDELMTEDAYTLKINYRPFNINFYSSYLNTDIALIIKLRKVSKNYYDFKKTLVQHVETQFGDIWDGVGQPLEVFSNVENGYGVFAGFCQVTDTVQKR